MNPEQREQTRQQIEDLYFKQYRPLHDPQKIRELFEEIRDLASKAEFDEWESFARGAILEDQEDNEGALRCFEETIQAHPEFAPAWNGKGNALDDLSRPEDALAAYGKAIDIDPEFAYPWNGKGSVLRKLGRPEDALAALEKVIELDPEFAYPWNGKGNALDDLGRSEEALAAYEKAIDIDPEFAYPWNGKGNALADLGKPEEALAAYKKAIEIDPEYSHPHFGTALVYLAQGEFEKARGPFERVLALGLKGEWPARAQLYIKQIDAELRARTEEEGSDEQEAAEDTASEYSFATDLYKSLEDRGLHKKVREKREEFEEKLKDAIAAPRKVKAGEPYDNTFFVLRDWNSYTPILPDRHRNPEISTVEHRLGGGYFLSWGGYGVVIDPGLDFVTQLYKKGLSIADVDAVVVTHCHLDHMRDVEALVDLNYRFNKEQGYGTGHADFRELKFFLCDSALAKFREYLERSECCTSPKQLRGADPPVDVTSAIRLQPRTVFHRDITSEDKAIGLVFDLTREDGSTTRLGLTSDSRWDDSLPGAFDGCEVLVTHLGTIEEEKDFVDKDLPNHLGLKGCHRLLRQVKPRLMILGEFGEELVGVRLEIARVMNEEKRPETQRVLAGDSNLAVALDGDDPTVWCSDPKCWPARCRIPLADLQPHIEDDGLFRYHCDTHFLKAK